MFEAFANALCLAGVVTLALALVQCWVVFGVTKNPAMLKLAAVGIFALGALVFVEVFSVTAP